MVNITLSKEKFNRVLHDVETLIDDVSELVDLDKIAEKRLADIHKNPNIGKSEEELNAYLKKRGVNIG